MDKAKNKKRIRGYILKALNISYPTPTLLESLQSSILSTLYAESVDILPFIEYLSDRGYIQVNKKQTDIGKFKYVKLTSKGIDLLEGTISDLGVLLDGGE